MLNQSPAERAYLDYSHASCCESTSASVDWVRLCDYLLNVWTIRLRKTRLPSLPPEPDEAGALTDSRDDLHEESGQRLWEGDVLEEELGRESAEGPFG